MVKKKNKKHWAKFRFEFVRRNKGAQKYHWRLIACNGKIVCHSEMFHAEHSSRKTVASIIDAIKKGQFKIIEEMQRER